MRETSSGISFRDPVSCALIVGAMTALIVSTSCGGGGSPPPPVVSVVSTALSDGTMGASYSQTVQASGGVAPFTWGVSTGSLPHGLNLGSSTSDMVTISGTPDTVQTNVSFTIQVKDSRGQAAEQIFSVDVKNTVVQAQSGALRNSICGAASRRPAMATTAGTTGVGRNTGCVGVRRHVHADRRQHQSGCGQRRLLVSEHFCVVASSAWAEAAGDGLYSWRQ